MDFQAVARPHGFRANREKMLILSTRSSIQVHTQYVSLQYPRIFQTNLGSLDLSYSENLMEQTSGCLFAFLCECGGLPYGNTGKGKLVLRNDLQARISKQSVTLSKQNAVKSMFL